MFQSIIKGRLIILAGDASIQETYVYYELPLDGEFENELSYEGSYVSY